MKDDKLNVEIWDIEADIFRRMSHLIGMDKMSADIKYIDAKKITFDVTLTYDETGRRAWGEYNGKRIYFEKNVEKNLGTFIYNLETNTVTCGTLENNWTDEILIPFKCQIINNIKDSKETVENIFKLLEGNRYIKT